MKILKKIKYPLTILIIVIILGCLIHLKKKLNKEQYQNVSTKEIVIESKVKENITNDTEDYCTIDIKGAVKNPGVYKVSCSKNVNDAIDISGGLTESADTSIINLAKKITNEMVIIIYTKEEVKNSNIVNNVIKVVEKECVCPNIQNDGCLNNEINDTINNNNLININIATLEELQKLPGIGEAKAKTIIDYREKNGNYKNIEDLLEVNGIGTNLYEQIKIYITT